MAKINPKKIQEIFRAKAAEDFLCFARGLIIPGATGAIMFDEVIADFQLETFEGMAASLQAVRVGKQPECQRFWVERTKKAGKDSDLAVCITWLLAFSRRPLKIQVSAANQKQASILKSRIEDLIHFNPWLDEYIKITQNRITGKILGGNLVQAVIESTGSAGAAHGETPDVLILNELVHVEKWGVMETHMNNADGVPHGVVIISTNAGYRGTKAEVWRNMALDNKDRWQTHIWSQPSPWASQENIDEARERNDPFEYARLWEGRWISGRGGALSEEDIGRVFHEDLTAMKGKEPDWSFVAGLDLGISHDHSGVAIVGVHQLENRLRVALVRGFEPTLQVGKKKEVDLQAVENMLRNAFHDFRLRAVFYDPAAGGSFMAQRLRRVGLPMREMTFGSAVNLTCMAQALVTSVKDGKLECYEDPEGRLRRDLGKFDIVAKIPSGFRLVSTADEYGHADVGTALVICLPFAMSLLDRQGLAADDSLIIEEGSFEEDGMPDELRDILDME